MAIEFRCSQCSQLLRVPDESQGKNARCPNCQALVMIPAAGEGDAATPPSPLTTSANPFGDAGAAGGSPFGAPPSLNPYASPAVPASPFAGQFQFAGARSGLPWEAERKTLGCWFRTMWLVISSPTLAFTIMRQGGGLGTPLLYNVYAVGMLMGVVAVIAIPILLFVWIAEAQRNNPPEPHVIAYGVGFAAALVLFYGVVLTVVTPLIWAGIYHVALLVFGGAKQGFETTFRVVCYAYFSALLPGMLLAVVPYLGGLGFAIWIIVLFVIGLSRAHEITGGKAAAAVLVPIAVCCGLYIAAIATFVAGPTFLDALKGG